jgi:hypothetical protein
MVCGEDDEGDDDEGDDGHVVKMMNTHASPTHMPQLLI